MAPVWLLVWLVALLALAPPARAGQLITIATPSRHVDPARIIFNGAEQPTELRANVLLPDGYDPARAYRVLFLLHGIGDNHGSWARPDRGDIVNTARGLDAIVVMPEADRGFYTNWWNGGRRADPGWERFYLDELIALIEQRFRVLPGRRNHAIAGLSMGGFGSTFLGGQRPDYFGAVATFSGFLQSQRPEVELGLRAVGGPEYQTIFGPRDAFYATGHNPTRLVENLRHSRNFVAIGSGTVEPGVASEPAAVIGGGAVEAGLRVQNEEFVDAARGARVALTYRPQLGVHDWPYWRRHLRQAIEWGLFDDVAERPEGWTYRTVAATGRMWTLRYDFAAPPEQVITFERTGDVLRGRGAGIVTVSDVETGCRFTAALPFDRPMPSVACPPRPTTAGRPERPPVRPAPPPTTGGRPERP
ncbi:MAG: esterase family protein, partial [Actinomycetota bacterium]|nr:esterase family protein [Actinomycetota bacterium]